MFCNKCGNYLEDDAKFCNKCGNKITSASGENAEVNPKNIYLSKVLMIISIFIIVIAVIIIALKFTGQSEKTISSSESVGTTTFNEVNNDSSTDYEGVLVKFYDSAYAKNTSQNISCYLPEMRTSLEETLSEYQAYENGDHSKYVETTDTPFRYLAAPDSTKHFYKIADNELAPTRELSADELKEISSTYGVDISKGYQVDTFNGYYMGTDPDAKDVKRHAYIKVGYVNGEWYIIEPVTEWLVDAL